MESNDARKEVAMILHEAFFKCLEAHRLSIKAVKKALEADDRELVKQVVFIPHAIAETAQTLGKAYFTVIKMEG